MKIVTMTFRRGLLWAAVSMVSTAFAGAAHSQTYELAYGTINSDGSLASGQGVASWRGGKGQYQLLFPKFTNPAAVVFSTYNKNYAVRFGFIGKSTDRKQYAAADHYDQTTTVDERPKLADGTVGFLAIARKDIKKQSTGSKTIAKPPKSAKPTALVSAADVQVAAGRHEGGKFTALSGATDSTPEKSTGLYRVTFSPAFAGTPTVLVTYHGFFKDQKKGTFNEPVRTAYVAAASATSADIGITDHDGKPVNAEFTFVSIGPPGTAATNANRLSNATIVYGRHELNGSRDFGDGAGKSKKKSPAQVDITFDRAFQASPYVIGSTEHTEERHLRQAQVTETAKGVTLQVAGRRKCCGLAEGNDSRFDYIAILPK